MKLSYRIIYCPIRPIGLISPIISSIPEKRQRLEKRSNLENLLKTLFYSYLLFPIGVYIT